jgi:hypothetical protein
MPIVIRKRINVLQISRSVGAAVAPFRGKSSIAFGAAPSGGRVAASVEAYTVAVRMASDRCFACAWNSRAHQISPLLSEPARYYV